LVGTSIPCDGITPYTPKLSYSVGAQYDYDTDIGRFSARVDGSYQGKLYTTAENTIWSKIPGRFIANGRLTWATRDDDWKVWLEVKNIFDKYYFESKSDATVSLGIVSGVPGLPRTWSVGVQRNFGPSAAPPPPPPAALPEPAPAPAPAPTYKQCLDNSVVPIDQACPVPPPPPPAAQGERG
jgi:hypothetical protein